MIDHKPKELVCEYPECDYQTLDKLRFDNHLARHKGIKQFHCQHDGCGKSFITSKSARRHEREVHESNNKHFVCDYPDCGQGFKSQVILSNHKKKHTSYGVEGKYVCPHEDCGKAFSNRNGLKIHAIMHSRKTCDWPRL